MRILAGLAASMMSLSGARAQGGVPSSDTTVAAAQVSASARAAILARHISLDVSKVQLRDALLLIARRAEIGIVHGDSVGNDPRTVTVHLKDVTVDEALRAVLKGSGYRATISQSRVIIIVRDTNRAEVDSAVGAVYGHVRDSTSGQGIMGAVVTVRGTVLQFATNDSGFYALPKVPSGMRTVVVRMLGYAPVEQQVMVVEAQIANIDFKMRMGMSRLQEMVTTATGPQRRLELGSDITILNADSIVATQPITSVTDLLDGRVPGLVVQHTSGAPGDPSRLRLRGSSSAYLSDDPIVIVDGVRVYAAQSDRRSANLASGSRAPSPVDYIDPHTIATIEVIKGPSAATLYGADAADGVIVITTKKGHAGPPRWTTSVERGISYMPGSYPDSYIRWGHMPWDRTLVPCPLSATDCVADSVSRFQPLNNTDETVFGRGNHTQGTVGVSGGSDALQYNMTANYDHDLGLLQLPDLEIVRYGATHGAAPPDWMQNPQQYSQWGVTTRLSAKLGSRADLSFTTMLSRSNQQRSSLEGELTSLMQTYVDPTTGTYYQVGGQLNATSDLLTDYYTKVTDEATVFTNGANLNYHLFSWLTASADAGLNIIQREDESLLPRDAALTSSDSAGALASARGNSLVGTVNVRATAVAPIMWGWHLQTSMGANYTDQRTSDLGASVTNLAEGSSSVAGGASVSSLSEIRQEAATFGWYVEPMISARRFWVSAGLRLDGGNSFGSNASLALFPKISASYLLSDEPFFPFKKLFNSFRLRAAYGHAGVQPLPGDRLRLYSTNSLTWLDGGFVDAVTLATLGNTQLKPERSREIEGGFDADMLDDRLSITATAYRKTRVDALVNFPLPPSVDGGVLSILKNIGEIRNTGYEVSASTQWLRTDAVTWSTQLQVSHNRNVVISLGPGVTPFGSLDSRVVAGYPLNGRWGRPVVGYSDLNGDGILQSNEVLYGDSAVYLGSSEPDYTASLNSTLSLFRSKVAISAGFAYSGGFTQLGPFAALRTSSRGYNDPSAPLSEQAAALSGEFSSFLSAQTVSTLRFNSLSIAFNLSNNFAQRFGARAMSIAVQGTNLGLHTNYRGKDPDVNNYGSGNGVEDSGVLPQPRAWQIRVSANY